MKTCLYCGSKVESYQQHYYCDFCEMKIDRIDVQEDGKRKNLLPASQPTLEDLQKSTPELMRFSIVELLFLLKFARHERSSIYNQRYTFIQALKQGENQFKEGEQYTFKEYEFYTRKCFVLENLIRERIGYYPAKLTDSYIQTLAQKMDESTNKQMTINSPKLI
jgi:hypothetical protein